MSYAIKLGDNYLKVTSRGRYAEVSDIAQAHRLNSERIAKIIAEELRTKHNYRNASVVELD